MSVRVQSFFHSPTNTWSHVVVDPAARAAAIVDPVLDFDAATGEASSASAQALLQWIDAQSLRAAWIVETHAHADHLTAADWLKQRFAERGEDVRIGIGAGIVAVQKHFRDVFALGAEFAADGAPFDRLFADGERFCVGQLDVHVIATPGHTGDGVSYQVGDAVFVGDTLFAPRCGTGRCDFPGADAATQFRSIRRLYDLPDATRVFLCHDYPSAGDEPVAMTTIGEQKRSNAQLRAETSASEYVALRRARDATLAVPRLLYPSLQANIQAGRLPPRDAAGRRAWHAPA